MDILIERNAAHAITVVRLRGELGLDSAPQLRDTLSTLIDQSHPPRIVVDLAQLHFCDSIGLSQFAEAHQRCTAAGGSIGLAAPTPLLLRILAVLGLLGPIPVYESVRAACVQDSAGLIHRAPALGG
jgi:anti-anti-sigma factor